MTGTLEDHWNSLASTALLGTQRRTARAGTEAEVPPGLLADVIESLPPGAVPDEPTSVLVQVSALSVARRCGVRPSAPARQLIPAPLDDRPVCPSAAVSRLKDLLESWPELFEEWITLVQRRGLRLPPETLIMLMTRFRSSPMVRAQVGALGGQTVTWLAELFPHLQPAARTASKAGAALPPGTSVAPPPYPREIVELVELAQRGKVATFVTSMTSRIENGVLANRNRAQLVNLVRQLPSEFLEPLAGALHRAGTNPQTMGLALSLADLAAFRRAMIDDFAANQEPHP